VGARNLDRLGQPVDLHFAGLQQFQDVRGVPGVEARLEVVAADLDFGLLGDRFVQWADQHVLLHFAVGALLSRFRPLGDPAFGQRLGIFGDDVRGLVHR